MVKTKLNETIPTCYVLFSGGLDSRLVLKIMQNLSVDNSKKNLAFQAKDKCNDKISSNNSSNIKQSQKNSKKLIPSSQELQHKSIKFKIVAITFKFPFGAGCCQPDCSFKFTQVNGIEHKIIDCTQGKLFQEYLEIIKKPKHGHGSGINPCIDCRIFILNKTKTMLRKNSRDFIVTGEVLGERPMSQHRKAMLIIDEETKLKEKILRPLSAKLLEPTESEINNLIDRSKLFNISGRSRKPQIALAEYYKIQYPTPAGGCLLCEKEFKIRLNDLFKRKEVKNIQPRDIQLLRIGRHFFFPEYKVIVGRNHNENILLENLKDKDEKLFMFKSLPGPSVLLQGSINEESIKQAKEHVLKFSKNKNKVV